MKKCLKKNPIGWVFTIVWVVGAAIFIARHNYCECIPLTLAEWGNFFAGVAAPIALVWLIVGHLETSKQMINQGKAMQRSTDTLLRHLEAFENRNEIAQESNRLKSNEIVENKELNNLKRQETEELNAQRKREARPDFINVTIGTNGGSFRVVSALAKEVKVNCKKFQTSRDYYKIVNTDETKQFKLKNRTCPSDFPFEFSINFEDKLGNKLENRYLAYSTSKVDVIS